MIRVAVANVQVVDDFAVIIELREVRYEFFIEATEDRDGRVRGQSCSSKGDLVFSIYCKRQSGYGGHVVAYNQGERI